MSKSTVESGILRGLTMCPELLQDKIVAERLRVLKTIICECDEDWIDFGGASLHAPSYQTLDISVLREEVVQNIGKLITRHALGIGRGFRQSHALEAK